MSSRYTDYKFVNSLWDDTTADALSPVERLVYRSNILGSDQRITNTGGGNTSSKIEEADPLSGEQVEVLWVKGSGGDLRTSKVENFSSLYQDKLIGLQKIYAKTTPNGVKTPIEDEMVHMYPHTTFNLNPRPSSIDTPLHSFIGAKHVDHMHPIAFIALAATKNSEALTKEIYGDELAYLPWQRPGFDLGLKMEEVYKTNKNAKGINMGQHGLINWADDDKECYELTLDLIEKAGRYIETKDRGADTFGGQKYGSLDEDSARKLTVELLPFLRGQVSQQTRFIATVHRTEQALEFINSNDAKRLAEIGTSCPDHFLRTKIKPLYVEWDPASGDIESLKAVVTSSLEQYRADYAEYYEACKHDNSPAMRDPNPTVILIPGLGMIAFGKNKSESRVTAEFYNCAIGVMRGAEAIDEYIGLPRQEAFDIEYWLLEEAKLQRMPKEKEFARKVVIVVGAGSGIGKETAIRFATDGAHIVCADLDEEAAKATAKEITSMFGKGIGVAGTGVSNCGMSIGCRMDITDSESIKACYEEVVYAYGGIDVVALTAGIFLAPSSDGEFSTKQMELVFKINAIGPYLIGHTAKPIFEAQGKHMKSAVVITTSVNGVVSKKGSVAYDSSKAATNHVVRELAVELAPYARVNAVAPATVVKGSLMFPRDRVMASLSKYDIAFSESEETDDLRLKLAEYYAQRTLTKSPITPEDQAEAIFFMASDKASKTTGQVINVDGGLYEAFLR
ncbi:bifunctional rhamnulose-1-phosphate aldolase/short-chain dehydrogenase [Haloferula sp.]|uniref:bifunctional rhamnulose-1-phosphate aldolase/short-chain dehydrogenase n=1 Tax=Haloferula sp. TaxID=2497595 RepID=UPI003C748D95